MAYYKVPPLCFQLTSTPAGVRCRWLTLLLGVLGGAEDVLAAMDGYNTTVFA